MKNNFFNCLLSKTKLLLSLALPLFFITACVNLTDRTGSDLTFSPQQTFAANVTAQGEVTINGVSVTLDDGPSQALMGSGLGLWLGDVSIDPCEELVSYRFTVDYSTGSSSRSINKTFPRTGSFVKPIRDIAPMCSGRVSASKVFDVNTRDDLVDNDPGDGICATSDSEVPVCSLRAAVMEANAHSGVDMIRIPNGRYTLTLEKPSGAESDSVAEDNWGDLDITDSVAIIGLARDSIHIGHLMQTGNSSSERFGYLMEVIGDIDEDTSNYHFAKVDGGEIDRVFQVHDIPDDGFAFFKKIAILNGNAIDRPGGGILNQGRLRLERVAVYDNTLQAVDPAGVFTRNQGAGIHNAGTLVAEELAIINNRIGSSGAGGGLWVNQNSEAVIKNSLISHNESRWGGAIYISEAQEGGDDAPGKLRLVNTTVAENKGSEDYVIDNHGRLSMQFVTVINNNRGGVKSWVNAKTYITKSLLADNPGGGRPYDCSGPIRASFNIIENNSCTGSGFTSSLINPSKAVGTNGLVYRGGFTYVSPIEPPSSWVADTILDPTDRIPNILSFDAPPTDQRGQGRRYDANGDGEADMDPGAFEYR